LLVELGEVVRGGAVVVPARFQSFLDVFSTPLVLMGHLLDHLGVELLVYLQLQFHLLFSVDLLPLHCWLVFISKLMINAVVKVKIVELLIFSIGSSRHLAVLDFAGVENCGELSKGDAVVDFVLLVQCVERAEHNRFG
jgi:hypothetical protein